MTNSPGGFFLLDLDLWGGLSTFVHKPPQRSFKHNRRPAPRCRPTGLISFRKSENLPRQLQFLLGREVLVKLLHIAINHPHNTPAASDKPP